METSYRQRASQKKWADILAAREQLRLETDNTGCRRIYRLIDGDGAFRTIVAEAVELKDGRWIDAGYDGEHYNWCSYDVPACLQSDGFRFAFAPSPEGLVTVGVRTYRTPTDCLRAGIKAWRK